MTAKQAVLGIIATIFGILLFGMLSDPPRERGSDRNPWSEPR